MAFVVSAIGAAWAAGAAIIGGAAITAAGVATIAAGVAAAGTVLTVVGKVTKSPELMKIGKVMSIAGGITAIGAGLISSVASAGASAASSGASNVVPNAAGGALEAAAGGGAVDAMANQAVDAAVSGAAQTFPIDGGIAALGESSTLNALGEAAGTGMSQAQGLASSTTGMAAPSVGATGLPSLGGAIDPSAGMQQAQALAGTSPAVTASPAPGMLQGVKDWWGALSASEKANMMLKVGGAGLDGIAKGWSEEQKMELQREINKEQQKRYDTGQKNANFVPVIGFQPRPTGLINSGPRG